MPNNVVGHVSDYYYDKPFMFYLKSEQPNTGLISASPVIGLRENGNFEVMQDAMAIH